MNPVCELLTLSAVRLAAATMRTLPGLRGLGLGSIPALPSRSGALEREPVSASELKSANPCSAGHARGTLSDVHVVK